ncbi:MAG: hypothetical protein KDB03_27335 [Planctomycetales bacterium]|nr:hypothetical protein [Planctomycetales bacterium]
MQLDSDICNLDLECIAFKVVWEEKWSLEKIDRIELDYRWFLQAIRLSDQDSLAPERDVDVFWHHHILDTRKYINDCNLLFGRYVHHFPYSGVLGDRDAGEQRKRYERSLVLISTLKGNADD